MTNEVLTIDGRREGYAPDQIIEKNGRSRGTMTVGELIAYLEQFDEDMPVLINNDNGYTYGSITESSFRDEEYEDDDEEEEEEEE